ncbi:MAG: hypothetical protein IPI19_18945 [Ignavibacteriales bacterium]|nr:hypothetical protein [Ignavibacteriales bacterium]
MYTGETEVRYLDLHLRYISLNPTGSVLALFILSISWGTPTNFTWIDYHKNPLITLSGSYLLDNMRNCTAGSIIRWWNI